jgi:hypothetical protein
MKTKILLLTLLIVTALLISGCLEYKAYDVPEEESEEELDLLDEIAEIERQLEENDLVGEELSGESLDPAVIEEIIEVENPTEGDNSLADAFKIYVKENDLVQLKATIVDPDKDEVSYTYSPPLDANGKWKTNYGDEGEYSVVVEATDGIHTTRQEVILIVERLNVVPMIKAVADTIAKEGDIINFKPEVSDPNGDEVTVTVSEPLALGSFETDHNSAGQYNIVVVASDGELESETSFLLTIEDINQLPTITNVEDLILKEGETVHLEPLIEDIDGDEVLVTISEPIGNDGVWETGFTDNGQYTITITANDGKDEIQGFIAVTVIDVNMPPEILNIELVN